MNVKQILLSVLALGSLTAQAQKTPVWCDPSVNEINRKMDVAHYFAYESEALAKQSQSPRANTKAKSSRYMSIELFPEYSLAVSSSRASSAAALVGVR